MKKIFNKKTKPSCSHDSFFKLFYSDPNLAKELLKLIFSKKELKAFNLNKIKVEKDNYGGKRADLILSIPFKNNTQVSLDLLILLEHKSFYDKNLYEQMLEYKIIFKKQSIKQKGYPQPIMAVLFYHGKNMDWKKSLLEKDFSPFLSKIPIEIKRDMLNYGLRVINTKDPKVRKVFKDKGFKSRGVIKLLDEIGSIKEPSSEKVKTIIKDYFGDMFRGKKEQEVNELVVGIVEYLRDTTGLKVEEWEKAEEELKGEGFLKIGGKTMDVLEIIKEKGRWEGRQEGRQEGWQKGRQEGRLERDKEVILNMLKNKIDNKLISKVTGLSEKEIKKLKNGK